MAVRPHAEQQQVDRLSDDGFVFARRGVEIRGLAVHAVHAMAGSGTCRSSASWIRR